MDCFSEGNGHEPISFTYGDESDSLLNCPFSLLELKKAIGKTRISTLREDRISAALFKGFNDHSLDCLLSLYNRIWHSDNILTSWTLAILPILKPQKLRHLVSSYGSIVLISVMGKICE